MLEDGSPRIGPFPALGRADRSMAAEHGNPAADPTKPFGDTPLGEYLGNLGYERDTPENRHSYGNPDDTHAIPVLRIYPAGGATDADKREESDQGKDPGLLIHAGALSESGQLRPTYGCVRIMQDNLPAILAEVAGIESFPVSIQPKENPAT